MTIPGTELHSARSLPQSAPFALIADDDPICRRLVRAILVEAGFATEFAASGVEALTAVAARKPSVIVLDLMMPIQDGFTTLARLRSDPAMRDVAIVVVTARANDEDERRCLAAGASAFLRKPIDPDDFAARINQLIAPALS